MLIPLCLWSLQVVAQNYIARQTPAHIQSTSNSLQWDSMLKGKKHVSPAFPLASKTAVNDTFTVAHFLGAQDTSGRFMWDFNWNYSQQDEMKWALTLFDTLHDSQGSPKAYSLTDQTKIDSIFVLCGHKKTSAPSVLDTITIEVFNFALSQYVWDTIIVTNSPLDISNDWLQPVLISIPCGHILNPNEAFAIRVGFAGPVAQDTFGIVVGFRNAGPCGASPVSAYQSNIPNNTYRLYAMLDTSFTPTPQYAYDFLYPNPNWNGIFYRDCNANTIYDPGTYEEELFQSAYIFADVIIGNFSVQPPVSSFTASATSICNNGCIDFTDLSTQGPTSWQWSFSGGSPGSSTLQNPTNICYSSPGTYDVSLTVSNSAGNNSANYTGYIVVSATQQAPVLSISPSNTICIGNTAVLSVANVCSGCTYTWQPGGQTGPTIPVTVAGTYQVTVNSQCGTSNSAPETIYVDQASNPVIQITPSPNLCQGQTGTITVQNPCNGCTYNWNPNGQTGNSIQVNSSGAYTAVLTNACGTYTSNAINVTMSSTPSPTVTISPTGPTTFCQGQSVVLAANGASNYLWSNGVPGNVLVVTSSGTFTVTGTDNNGCSGISAPIIVAVYPLPPVPVITVNGNVLGSSSALGNQWFLNNGAIPGANQQSHTATQSGLYHVTVTDGNNCSSQSAPVNIILNSRDEPLESFMLVYPNPGAGRFTVYFPQALPETHIEVTDIHGRAIRSVALPFIHAAGQVDLDLSDYPSGVYRLHMESGAQKQVMNLMILK